MRSTCSQANGASHPGVSHPPRERKSMRCQCRRRSLLAQQASSVRPGWPRRRGTSGLTGDPTAHRVRRFRRGAVWPRTWSRPPVLRVRRRRGQRRCASSWHSVRSVPARSSNLDEVGLVAGQQEVVVDDATNRLPRTAPGRAQTRCDGKPPTDLWLTRTILYEQMFDVSPSSEKCRSLRHGSGPRMLETGSECSGFGWVGSAVRHRSRATQIGRASPLHSCYSSPRAAPPRSRP